MNARTHKCVLFVLLMIAKICHSILGTKFDSISALCHAQFIYMNLVIYVIYLVYVLHV